MRGTEDFQVKDLAGWLKALATEALPGGVAAAAVASAMGAALVVKVTYVTLQRHSVTGAERAALQATLDLASRQQAALMQLADADERAYRAVLEGQALRHGSPAEGTAWYEATEVPVRVAETCHLLLERMPGILGLCPSAVKPDLEIGVWLLETGKRAGLLAAENNVRAWEAGVDLTPLQARIDALKEV
jgi:formiminotetrahydrofolate cyclodeaminase